MKAPTLPTPQTPSPQESMRMYSSCFGIAVGSYVYGNLEAYEEPLKEPLTRTSTVLEGSWDFVTAVNKSVFSYDRAAATIVNNLISICTILIKIFSLLTKSHDSPRTPFELRTYITQNPNSIIAVNLKACSHYQLYNGKADLGRVKSGV